MYERFELEEAISPRKLLGALERTAGEFGWNSLSIDETIPGGYKIDGNGRICRITR